MGQRISRVVVGKKTIITVERLFCFARSSGGSPLLDLLEDPSTRRWTR